MFGEFRSRNATLRVFCFFLGNSHSSSFFYIVTYSIPSINMLIMWSASISVPVCFALCLLGVLLNGSGPVLDRAIVKALKDLGRPKTECKLIVSCFIHVHMIYYFVSQMVVHVCLAQLAGVCDEFFFSLTGFQQKIVCVCNILGVLVRWQSVLSSTHKMAILDFFSTVKWFGTSW